MSMEKSGRSLIDELGRAVAAGEGGENALAALATAIVDAGDGALAAWTLPQMLASERQFGILTSLTESLKRLVAQSSLSGADADALRNGPGWLAPAAPAFVAVKLLAGGMVSEGEFIVMAEDLANRAPLGGATGRNAIHSALHILDARWRPRVARAMVYLARDAVTPLIPLSRFQPPRDVFRALSPEFMERRGALAFDRLDDQLMVAVLNPYDEVLRGDVRQCVRKPCAFFLAFPGEYDTTAAFMLE